MGKVSKSVLFAFVFLIISLSISNNTYAQNIQSVNVAIGNPSSSDATGVVKWAQEITDHLGKLGPSCLYNVQTATICNESNVCATKLPGDCNGLNGNIGYLCTQLVRDSYNLAGLKNSFSLNTYYLFQQWGNRSGYSTSTSNDQETIQKLKPGDPIFMFLTFSPTALKHVVIIKNVEVDSNGSGHIDILQSNSEGVTNYYPIRNWKVIHYYRSDPNSLMYFGFAP